MLFQSLLKHMIREGTLRLQTANGRVYAYGNGLPPRSAIKLHRRSLEWTLALQPDLKVAEAYIDGLLTIEEGGLRDFLHVIFLNMPRLQHHPLVHWLDRLVYHTRRLKQFNPIPRARRNVAFHYDLSTQLYDLFLDADRQYSCGLFHHASLPASNRPSTTKTPHRRQALSQSTGPRARYRLRMGRFGPLSGTRSVL